MSKPKLITYVAFTSARDIHPPCGLEVIEVASRSIDKLDIPKTAYEFYFLDAPDTIEARQDPLGHEINSSPVYVVAKEIWTKEKLQNHFATSADFKRKSEDKTVVGRMTKGDIYRGVWLAKANSTPFHAIARTGEIIQLRPGMIVIDEQKRIMSFGEKPKKPVYVPKGR